VQFLRQKNFNNASSIPLLLTLLIVTTGCSWLGNIAPKPKLVSDYNDKIFRLDTNSPNIEEDLPKISDDTFSFIEVNETTASCDPFEDATKREQCYNDFWRLKRGKK